MASNAGNEREKNNDRKIKWTIPEVIPQCQVVYEDCEKFLDKENYDCDDKEGHRFHIPVTKLKKDYLPPEYRTEEMMKEIFVRCTLTVLVRAPYTSTKRPDYQKDRKRPYPYAECKGNERIVRFGTGSIAEVFYHQPVIGKRCPCLKCKETGLPKKVFWWVCVRTATHVIYDSSEAKRATFYCFYDAGKEKEKNVLYGMGVFNIMPNSEDPYRNDACYLWAITHDFDTVAVLNEMQPSKKFIIDPQSTKKSDPSKMIVSHPHGLSKTVTLGNVHYLSVPFNDEQNRLFSKQAVYRKVSEIGQSIPKEPPVPYDKDSTDTEFYDKNWTSLDDGIKTSDEYKNYEKLQADAVGLHVAKSEITENVSEEYMREFYISFIRHSCLMHLFVSGVEHKRKEGFGVDSTKEAVKYIFLIFFGTEYCPTSEVDKEPEMETRETVYQHWVNMLEEGRKQMFDEVSKRETVSSRFLEIFHEAKREIDTISIDLLMNDKHKAQETVIDLLYRTKEVCLKIIPELSERKEHDQEQRIDKKDEEKNTDAVSYGGEEEKDEQGQQLKEQELEGEVTAVPPGTTYILPESSEIEYRFYPQRPEWVSFPPGTKINFPDGSFLDADLYEFKDPGLDPQHGYLTYDINTCDGCSGAGMKFDTTGHFARTFFPHSGKDEETKSYAISGTQRESGKLTYPKLVLNSSS